MNGGRPLKVLSLPASGSWGDVLIVPASDTDTLEQMYRSTFEDEEPEMEGKLTELLEEQNELIKSLRKIPEAAVSALRKVQQELKDVESQIAKVRRMLENAADQFRAADEEWGRLNERWEEAQAAMETDMTARRRAEAVRQVITKVVVTFEPTGKKKPLGRVKSVVVLPKTLRNGDVWQCESECPRRSSRTSTGSG